MYGSIERVRAVIQGRPPDRPPLFELLRNTAVIEHFTGRKLTEDNGAEWVFEAYAPAVDATRPAVKYPATLRRDVLPDGRRRDVFRWTVWTEPRRFPDSAAYEREMRARLHAFDPSWTPEDQSAMDRSLAAAAEHRRRLGEVYLFAGIPGPSLSSLYTEVGFESFSYYLADCPDVIAELLEMNTLRAERWYRHLPDQHGIEGGFLGDDIAFKSGPLVNPDWMRREYFPRLARAIARAHARGIRVLFHSDGNLNPILDDLVSAGMDGLNPIEVLAGMDVGAIHRRYPHLFLAGGIDVSQLLPFGTPQQVKDAVRKVVHDAEGRILVGSSTELHEEVPLANFLALREAVMEGL